MSVFQQLLRCLAGCARPAEARAGGMGWGKGAALLEIGSPAWLGLPGGLHWASHQSRPRGPGGGPGWMRAHRWHPSHAHCGHRAGWCPWSAPEQGRGRVGVAKRGERLSEGPRVH